MAVFSSARSAAIRLMAGVLGFLFLEPLELRQRHAGIFALPLVLRRVADAVLAADFSDRDARSALGQNRQDLALRKS